MSINLFNLISWEITQSSVFKFCGACADWNDDTTFRWSYAGLTFCLTSEEIESLVTKVRDYQLGITVSDEDNSISAKATKMQRCRESLAVTTATPSFQRFEYRLAILRSLQGPLRRAKTEKLPYNEPTERRIHPGGNKTHHVYQKLYILYGT